MIRVSVTDRNRQDPQLSERATELTFSRKTRLEKQKAFTPFSFL
jgi:hypothetical protein